MQNLKNLSDAIGDDIDSSRLVAASNEEEDALFAKADKARKDAARGAIHFCFIMTLRIAFSVGIVVLLVRVWHLITPNCWQWLSDYQIQTIEKLVFSGAIGGFIGKYFNQVISR